MLSLPEKVLAIDDALRAARLPHAFGGALALAYYAEPRATIDIDVNVFVTADQAERVEQALTPLEVRSGDRAVLERDGQQRWWWAETPVDVFLNNDPIHDAMKERRRRVMFGEQRIPILGPEHLMVCKVAFDRPKDWIDLEQIIALDPDLDRAELDRWLERGFDTDDPRRARLEGLLARAGI